MLFQKSSLLLFWVLSIEDFKDRFHKRKWRMPAEMLETSCSASYYSMKPIFRQGGYLNDYIMVFEDCGNCIAMEQSDFTSVSGKIYF